MSEQYLGNMVFDITGSLKSYEFTKNSVLNLNRIISSKQFENQSSDTIFHYLLEQMEVVSFGDYLRRYIFECAGLGEEGQKEEFRDVPEDYFVRYIADAFEMNRAPHSFHPVKTRWSNIIKRWLRGDTVKRSTVFLLGFGLNMTDEDVSVFLTKVLKEQDFNFADPEETAYWFCYHHGLPYSRASALLEYYKNLQADGGNPEFWRSVQDVLKVYLSNETKLKEYLLYLKGGFTRRQDAAGKEFEQLYERAVAAARRESQNEMKSPREEREVTGAFDIEAVLCSGVPRTSQKNLASMTKSVLSRQFLNKRISRQRLSRLLRGEISAERFDFITLLFLVYAVLVEPEWPTSRYMLFIDEANAMLERCGMMGVYPVNPYESFVLMCLLTDDPLAVYNDVWEMSFDD